MYNQKTKKFSFKYDKALNALLYVTKNVHNLYNVVKVFYFADKLHLSKYGRFIFGDTYIAMEKGPVPSKIYDMIKSVRENRLDFQSAKLKKAIKVEKNDIYAIADPDFDYLSKSDLECLDEAVAKYGFADHRIIYKESHDSAYNSTELNSEIMVEKIIGTLNNKEAVKDYIDNF
mgnify:CR=1 FL=1